MRSFSLVIWVNTNRTIQLSVIWERYKEKRRARKQMLNWNVRTFLCQILIKYPINDVLRVVIAKKSHGIRIICVFDSHTTTLEIVGETWENVCQKVNTNTWTHKQNDHVFLSSSFSSLAFSTPSSHCVVVVVGAVVSFVFCFVLADAH